MKKIYQIGGLILFLLINGKNLNAQLVTQTLNFTGSVQTLTVPACVANVAFTVYGAQGVNGASTASGAIGGNGGLGAMASGVFTLSGASTLNVYVGGAGTGSVGGFNGGGNGAANTNVGGAGGGASDVRLNGNALTDRIIVAGGGGGGGTGGCASSTISGGNGGAGGGGNGTAGVNSQAGGGGQGGSGATGGIEGIGCFAAAGTAGTSGVSGVGGNGGSSVLICGSRPSGGGGGGGFVGGGGGGGGTAGTTSCSLQDTGGGGGGAGGTNFFIAGFTSTTATNGVRTGNGLVILSYSIGIIPTVVASGAATICAGAIRTLTASGASTFSWSTTESTATISVSPTINTTYTVTGQNVPGCSNTAAVTVSVNARPNPTITASAASGTFCSGTSVSLTASGANTYSWSTAASGSSIVASPSVNTNYTLTGTSAASLGTCSNTAVFSLTVVTTPTVVTASTPTAICLGSTAVLSASGAVTYTWNNSSTTSSISVSPTSTGTTIYTVTGYNTASTCVNTKTVSLLVNAIPVVVVASPTTCNTYTINLTASGASTYTWNTNSNLATIAINPSVNTSYTVIGRSAAGCTNVAVSNVTVNTSPTLTLSNSSPTICSGSTATLTATGAASIVWNGVTTVTNGLAFIPSVTGNYTAIGTSAQGCSNTAVTSISVTVTPLNIPTSSPSQLCIGNCATISVAGASNYTWLPMNVNTNSIAVCPTISTTYTVIKANGPCVDTKTFVLTVNNLPGLLLFSSNATVCASNTTQLIGGGANTYTWLPLNVGGSSVVITPSATTIYTLRGSNGTCANTETIQINTLANPTISIAASSGTICRGFCTTLTAGGADTYTWTSTPPSSGGGLSGTVAVDCPTVTTTYTVRGTNALGCTTGTTRGILVNSNPTISPFPTPSLVCVAGTSTLSANPTILSGVTYSWSTGASSRTNAVSPLTTSVYSVTATFTATQCKTENTVAVAVFVPSFAIGGPTAVCAGGTIVITASPVAGFTYSWTGGANPAVGFPSYAVSPTVPSIYVCSGSATLNGVACISTRTAGVAIYLNPTVTAVVSKTLSCKGDQIFLTGGGAATYVWSDNLGYTLTGSPAAITPTANQLTYTVVGTDDNGCPGTATVIVRTSFCPGFNEISNNKNALIIYPNPNNGEFKIEGTSEMNLQIIDELGRVVKTISIKESNGFETSVKGLSGGVYFIVGDKNDSKIHQKIIIKD